jgi:hypothetical protein
MHKFVVGVGALVVAACASTSAPVGTPGATLSPSQESECSQFYSLSKKDPSVFSGYGQGRVHEVSVDAARADLAKEISIEISASGTVHETEKDVSVASAVQSRVNASLVDVRIAKKCVVGESHEAVATLRRDMFLNGMRKALTAEDAKAQGYANRVRSVKGSQRPLLLVEAKNFLEQTTYNQTFELCSRLGGCAAAPRAGIDALREMFDDKSLAEEAQQANMFRPEFKGALAQESDTQVIALLKEKGWVLSDEALPSKQAKVECGETVFPKIAGTDQQILEISCRVIGTVEGIKQFNYVFTGKGVASSVETARTLARNQMREEK